MWVPEFVRSWTLATFQNAVFIFFFPQITPFSDVWYKYLESMEEHFHFGIAGVGNDDALYIAEAIARELRIPIPGEIFALGAGETANSGEWSGSLSEKKVHWTCTVEELGLTEGRFSAALGSFLLPISESAMASGD
jgi:hypothetical protein